MEALGRQMNLVGGPSEALLPKNVGLLFFNDEPHRFFHATQIDVVYFPEGAGGLDLTEGRSTGVPKILRAMKSNGSPPPEFESDEDRTHFLIRLPVHERAEPATGQVTLHVTPHVTPHVERLVAAMDGEHRRDDLLQRLGLSDRKYLRTRFLAPAMAAGLLEMTDPGSPRSRQQRYRLTDLGRRWKAELASRAPDDAERDGE